MKSLALALLFVWAATAVAVETVEPNKIKTFAKEEGKPMEVIFNDGRVIGFRVFHRFVPVRSSLTLSDNSCTAAYGQKFEYVIPSIARSILPYWKKHPTKQGRFITVYDEFNKVTEVKSSTAMFTSLNDDSFSTRLREIVASSVEDKEALTIGLANPDAFGYLNCAGDCSGVLPENGTIQFWDENFEMSGDETMMVENSQNSPSLNQMSSRLQKMQLTIKDGYILFGKPTQTFGFFAKLFPPGITYQVLWSIKSKNLVDSTDSLCQLNWSMDFTRVFNTFDGAFNMVRDVEIATRNNYPEYNFTSSDSKNMSLNDVFSNDTWESSEIHK